MEDTSVPWAVEIHDNIIDLPGPSHQSLHTLSYITSPASPWVVLCNPLFTNASFWTRISPVLPALTTRGYNVLTFDQRGHGSSTVPDPPVSTINDLADDLALLTDRLCGGKVYAIMGVSQGALAALNFAIRYPGRAEKVVACDTHVKAPAENVALYEARIALANTQGMHVLAERTAARWFPNREYVDDEKFASVVSMIETAPLRGTILGFVPGARALQSYDLFSVGLLQGKTNTLLIAGSEDGEVPNHMKKVAEEWSIKGGVVRYEEVKGAGHLPMVDRTDAWLAIVVDFLGNQVV